MRQLFWIPLSLSVLIPLSARADEPFDSVLKNLQWRGIGPATMGGRIDDFAVPVGSSNVIYVASAAGGIFKSTNNGTTWQPIFDDQATSSIGDIAIAPSNANILYVGSGEANNRQSSSWGNGVYKSTDAGKTWVHCGLADSMHIDRIVVDPKNPDVAFVAALGRLWGPNAERGVYKTADGGKTWTKSLFVNEDTGCTDIVIDPQNPDTLIAAMYQRRRTAFGFNGGGPGSGMYKTTDGGATWKKLTNGLPDGDTGRIGLDIYARNGKIVMACVENTNSSGVYRSEDGGETWKKLSSTNARPMYYSQIRIDPSNDQRIWMGGVSCYFSSDGGKNFSTSVFRNIHSDFHAIWIDPADGNHVLLGCDGGIQATYDGGGNWDVVNTFACSQFYEVCFDMRKPYWVYGGLQDNGSWGSPHMKPAPTGPLNSDWVRIGGGDGFYAQADPTDPDTVYSESQQGSVSRLNMSTGERKSIRPRAESAKPAYRFDWNSPILISPHNHNKVLFGGNRLFISTDRGDSWRTTDDLSGKPDRDAMPIMGVKVGPKTLSRHDGQESFGQIVTVTESPVKAGVIYVGTDDGMLQVSKDDGNTWKNVAGNVSGVPKGTYVTRVHASKAAEGRCYASFDGHRSNDFKPYIFVTEDFGETWRPMVNGIPEGSTVHVIREHFRNPNLLFAGTERGLFVSFDRGGSWRPMAGQLPMVPVFDLQIHPRENDLILATHGRGIWVLDDITVLEQAASNSPSPGPSPLIASSMWLFSPRTTIEWRMNDTSWFGGQRGFTTRNPAQGAIIQYWLSKAPTTGEDPKITIYEKDGKTVVRELRQTLATSGLNRTVWDLRYASPTQAAGGGGRGGNVAGGGRRGGNRVAAAGQGGAPGTDGASSEAGAGQVPTGGRRGGGGQGAGAAGGGGQGAGAGGGGGRGGGGGGGGGGGFGGFGARGPRVLPGTYIVRLEQGKDVREATIVVEDDPRVKIKDSERKSIFQTIRKLNAHYAAVSSSRSAAEDLQGQLRSIKESEAFKSAPRETQDAVTAVSDKVRKLVERIQPPRPEAPPAEEGTPPQRPPTPPTVLTSLGRLTATLDSFTEVPSPALRKEGDTLSDGAKAIVKEVNDLIGRDVPSLNQKLESAKLKLIKAPSQVRIARQGEPIVSIAAEDEESDSILGDADDEDGEHD